MAIESHGPTARRPVALAMDLLRKDRAISYREFLVMFPFARQLFRECIRMCGPKDVRLIRKLKEPARLYRISDKRSRGPAVPQL